MFTRVGGSEGTRGWRRWRGVVDWTGWPTQHQGGCTEIDDGGGREDQKRSAGQAGGGQGLKEGPGHGDEHDAASRATTGMAAALQGEGVMESKAALAEKGPREEVEEGGMRRRGGFTV